MSKLAAEHQSVNLGQGFPDDEGPESMKQVGAASNAASSSPVLTPQTGDVPVVTSITD